MEAAQIPGQPDGLENPLKFRVLPPLPEKTAKQLADEKIIEDELREELDGLLAGELAEHYDVDYATAKKTLEPRPKDEIVLKDDKGQS